MAVVITDTLFAPPQPGMIPAAMIPYKKFNIFRHNPEVQKSFLGPGSFEMDMGDATLSCGYRNQNIKSGALASSGILRRGPVQLVLVLN